MNGLWSLTCANDLSDVSRSCRLMGPEVPEKPQGTPTADGCISALYGSPGSSNGLVSSESGGAWMSSDWRSADALRDRGVLMIDDNSEVTGASEPAVPASPRTPYSERRVARARRAKAHELIERLVAEGRFRITDPDDDEVAEWRRVVNYAQRHGLEPVGKRIEKVPYGGPGLELFLADGPHPNARSQHFAVPVKGSQRGHVQQFLTMPKGAECCASSSPRTASWLCPNTRARPKARDRREPRTCGPTDRAASRDRPWSRCGRTRTADNSAGPDPGSRPSGLWTDLPKEGVIRRVSPAAPASECVSARSVRSAPPAGRSRTS